jgi:hypothetical protein
MKKLLLFFCIVLTSVSISQTVDGGFDTFINGSVYEVTLFTNMNSGVGTAGVLTLEFTFNNAALSFAATPVSGTDYTLFGDFGSFTTRNITRPNPDRVRVSLLTTGSPAPVPLTTTPTNVVKLFFTITNAAGNSNLVWTQTSVAPAFLQSNYTVGTWPNSNESPLPVELVSFTGKTVEDYKIELKWETSTEVNNFGFDIERQTSNGQWDKVAFVAGNGNSNSTKTYSFRDNNPSGGSKFLYRLKQIDNDGQFEYSDAVEVMLIPQEYKLYQNYPNPFNPMTKIKFAIPQAGKVSLKLFDIKGEELAELVNTDYEPGYYDIELNLSNLASGVYIYRLQSKGFSDVKKLMLIK